MAIIDDMLDRLVSLYKKGTDGNIYKLLNAISEELDEIDNLADEIELIKDIDYVTGKQLDMLGQNVQQNRGKLNDEKYRVLIKAKIARNISTGTISDIINVVSTMMMIEKSSIYIEGNYGNEPASIYISVPVKPLAEFGLTREQFIIIINRLLAAGVRAYTRLEGTYQYNDTPSNGTIYDYNHGLSNLYDDSLFALSFNDVNIMNTYMLPGIYDGGYFSSWHSPPDIAELPGWK